MDTAPLPGAARPVVEISGVSKACFERRADSPWRRSQTSTCPGAGEFISSSGRPGGKSTLLRIVTDPPTQAR
jgi:hypothetical protein